MELTFAPLEGITTWVFRALHHEMFPGAAAYYAPFFAPTMDSPLTGRGLDDLLPAHNEGVPLVPQLLTNRADAFLAASAELEALGYEEVNLNLGCPSGTVVAKRKGSGFLGLPAELDAFLDEVFSRTRLRVSVKTRVGLEDPAEWPALLDIFNKYPIAELTVHPRVRKDFYREPVRLEAFRYAVDHTSLPLCYNGDLNSAGDCSASMARTYDIEIQIPSMQGYKEVSSVSNARDYQARRGNIRFRREGGKPEFVHTLNGSGLATSRIFPAMVEQNQLKDGSVKVPEVLQKYLGGLEVITKK